MKRWLILLFAGIIVGSTAFLNIWSIMQKPLLAHFPGTTPSEVVFVYSLTMLVMGITAPFAGLLMDKFGPRMVLLIGCAMCVSGCYMTAYTTALWQVYITYCIVMGIGNGLLYTNCVANTVKWFPDRKALAAGVIVTFGALAPMVWGPLALRLMEGTTNVMSIFSTFGIIFIFSMLALAVFVTPPDPGYVPEGWNPQTDRHGKPSRAVPDKDIWSMIKDPLFYGVLLTFMFGVGTGGMMVGHSASIAVDQIGMTRAMAASTVTVFALCNAAGRILLGYCSDAFGRFLIQGCIFAVYILGANVLNIATTTPMFMAGCGLIAFGWGGTWAAYPAIVSEFWGQKNLGANYGLVFIGASIGSYVYPKIAAMAVEATGTYTLAYITAMVFAVIGILVCCILNKAARKRAACPA